MGGITGFDMTAVFAIADALGMDRQPVALLFPYIEDGMIRAFKKRLDENG